MKIRHLILGLFASAAVLVSCQQEEEQLGAPALNINPETIAFDTDGGHQTIQMTATRDWAITNGSEWLAFDPESGKGSNDAQEITVTVLSNPGTDRTCDVLFSIGMIQKTLTVSQKGPKGEAEPEIISCLDFVKAADSSTESILKGVVENLSIRENYKGFDLYDGTAVVSCAFPINLEEKADEIKNGKIVTVKGKYTFYDKKKLHQVDKAEILKIEEGSIPEVEIQKLTIKEFIEKAETYMKYEVTGNIVGNVSNAGFKGFDLSDGTGKVTCAFPANFDEYVDQLKPGSKVTIQGAYQFFTDKQSHQVNNGRIIKVEDGGGVTPPSGDIEKVSVADFLQKKDISNTYELKGTISNLKQKNAEGKGFFGFDLEDGTGKVSCAFPENWDSWNTKLKNGQIVTIQGKYNEYSGKGQMKNGTIIKSEEGGAVNPDPEPEKPVEGAVFSASFASNLGGFTISDTNKPSGLSCVWQQDSNYKCVKATGHTGGKDGQKLAAESSLISPEINLEGVAEAYLTFMHAGNYFSKAEESCSAEISKDGGRTWNKLSLNFEGFSNFKWLNAGHWDLKDYLGSKIQVKLTYKSTSSNCGTWEVKDFAVMKGKYTPEEIPALKHSVVSTIQWKVVESAYSDKARVNGSAETAVLKLGKGKGPGTATLTIPSGTAKIGFYAVSWVGESCAMTFKNGSTILKELAPKANEGASNLSPYTITLSESDYYEIETQGATEITVETSPVDKKKRGILIGINPVK